VPPLGLGIKQHVGSAPFTPATIAGLVFDLDPSRGVVLSGSDVSTVADQSGTGDANKNMTIGPTAPQFTASSASYNSQPAITVNSTSNCCLVTGTWTSALVQPCTVIVVGHTVGASGAYAFDSLNAGAQMGMNGIASGVGLFAGASLSTIVGVQNTPSFLVAVFNSTTSSVRVNAKTAQATGDAGTDGAAGLTIGNWAGKTQPLNGPLARMLVYSRVLTSLEIGSLATYVTATYGVAIAA
jgi:hypothetical protein